MKYQDNIQSVAALQPDYLGFIFWEPSSRYFKGDIPQLPKHIKKVGVFVDAPVEEVISTVEKHDLQVVQLHGKEDAAYCRKFRSLCHSSLPARQSGGDAESIEIIKVFSIKDDFDFSVLRDFEGVCDYFLFDTKGKLPGGNGYAFDWTVLENYPSKKPFFLSGGIGLEEVDNVLSFLRRQESNYCHAIDVNSRFEIKAGLKDEKKLKEFENTLKKNGSLPAQE
ncbi:phosphoribosylanthranilate isomerase [Sungkyunkwania multivorans]|uniref:N-(5'-phosphoribosyl)anthranilate isomerase n=1 Tax=Sungkyunkwania multivorans TaxID=1173618 RepID=A0ABW3CZP6_9FLAO